MRNIKIYVAISLLILSGCAEFGNEEATTIAPVENSSDINPSETETETTATGAELSPSKWSQKKKYQFYSERYYINIQELGISAEYISATTHPSTMNLVYEKKNPQNESVNRDEAASILTLYSSLTDAYLNESNGEVNESWVPKNLNVTALDPETKEVYWYGHTNYSVMNRYRTNETTYANYFLRYVQSIENGPAHPEYETD